MIDFQEVKAAHPITEVADRLGLTLKKDGAALRGKCPSGAEGERKFVITPAKGAWYSFAAQKGGDCISLVAFVKGIGLKDAAAWIIGDNEPEKKKPKAAEGEPAAKPSEGFKPLDYLQYDHEAVIAVGFDPDVAMKLGIGYAPRGVMRGTIAIPVRDSNGKLCGYVGVTDAKLPSNWHL